MTVKHLAFLVLKKSKL